MNHPSHLVDRGQNLLKLLYFIMILNTIYLPYKAWPINKILNPRGKLVVFKS
jgi:hypothetical protein